MQPAQQPPNNQPLGPRQKYSVKGKLKMMVSRRKARSYTPLNILDFLYDEPLDYDWSWRLWWKPMVGFGWAGFAIIEASNRVMAKNAFGKTNTAAQLDRIAQLDSSNISGAFLYFWTNSMPLWMGVIQKSLAFIAVFGIGWFAIRIGNKSNENGYFPAKDFVLPMALAILLATPVNMAGAARSVKDVMNQAGEQVLEVIGAKNSIEQGKALESYGIMISSKLKECDGAEIGTAQHDCFNEAAFQIGQMTAIDKQRFGDKPWIRKQDEIGGKIENLKDESFTDALFNFGGQLVTVAEEALMVILDAVLQAFQFVLEIGYILTALLMPIALMLGFTSLEAMAPLAWLTAMASFGSIKFFNNLMIAIGADFLIGSEGAAQVVFGFFSAICAPMLAIGLAGGGGMAIVVGFLQFGSQAANAKQGN